MIKKILMGLVLLISLLLISLYIYKESKIPQREGELNLSILSSEVEVIYDSYGIPHIYANNDEDLYRALGYIHAQDRLFQFEILRRVSTGQMAEILGDQLVDMDTLYRTLGLKSFGRKLIEHNKQNGNPKAIALLENYLKGVNAFVAEGTTPVEFDILGIPKNPFEIEDIAAIMGLMSYSFAHAAYDDPLIYMIGNQYGEEYLKDLDITFTEGFLKLPVEQQKLKAIASEIATVIHQQQAFGIFHGSNSWLLSPEKSASGSAVLVNDPHIAFSQPSVWYEAYLESDNTSLYGHFLGLVPMPMLGFNEKLSWGLTMFENDDMDLYLEKLNPENDNQYWVVDHWEDFAIREEIIKVKDKPDVVLNIKTSRHGPIVNHLAKDFKNAAYLFPKLEQPIAMSWAYLDAENGIIQTFYELPFADTVEKAASAASKTFAPGLNLMYANANGDIAWWAMGKLPIRPEHVNSKTLLDGASGKDDVLGYHDFSLNPQNVNPESGYIYTANNQPDDTGIGLVPGYYSPKDRPLRITQILDSKDKHSVDDMKVMLLDNTVPVVSLFQSISLPILKQHRDAFSSNAQQAIDIFEKWQGNHDPEEVAATLYTRYRFKLVELAMADEIGPELFKSFQHNFFLDRTLWRLIPNGSSPWWNNVNTDVVETQEQIIVQAWKETIEFLENKIGTDVHAWTRDKDVSLLHAHPLGAVKPLDQLFNVGPFPSNAGKEAINNMMYTNKGDDLTIMLGPSTRRIIDFADIYNTWGINPTGQSGVAFDKYYDDQAYDYSVGNYRPQIIDRKTLDQNKTERLKLIPLH